MTSAWPLSAAATALLCDLREGGPPQTSAATLSRLAVKELVLRGQLRVVAVKKRRLRRNIVTVATAPIGAAGPLAPPLDFLASRIPATSGEDLSALIKVATQRQPQAFAEELKQSALGDLRRRGLIEDRKKRVLGMFSTTYPAPTPLGQQWQQVGRQHLAAAQSLPDLAQQDRERATHTARSLGALVLLAPAALATVALLAVLGPSTSRTPSADVDLDDDSFDVLSACVAALGDVAEDLGGALDGLDSAFDAVADAVDSAIDSGISDGGGDGGSSSDGGDGGGGGGD